MDDRRSVVVVALERAAGMVVDGEAGFKTPPRKTVDALQTADPWARTTSPQPRPLSKPRLDGAFQIKALAQHSWAALPQIAPFSKISVKTSG